MGILGSREDEGTFINPLEWKWCNKCYKDVHISILKKCKKNKVCINYNTKK